MPSASCLSRHPQKILSRCCYDWLKYSSGRLGDTARQAGAAVIPITASLRRAWSSVRCTPSSVILPSCGFQARSGWLKLRTNFG